MYPCGKCILCKEKKRRQWALRLESEKAYSSSTFFVTLTYSDEFLFYKYSDCPPSLCKRHYQTFLKDLRRSLPFKIRFFGVGEYGSESSRPHYHFMIFCPVHIKMSEFRSLVTKCWTKGFNTVKNGAVQRMYYIAKYTVKGSSHPYGTDLPFQTTSIKPPLGYRHFDSNKHFLDSDLSFNAYVSTSGRKSSIPRSFENKYKKSIDNEPRCNLTSPSFTRKSILQKQASYRLKDYLNKFNQLSPSEFMEMRDNIERRYYKKHKKLTNI